MNNLRSNNLKAKLRTNWRLLLLALAVVATLNPATMLITALLSSIALGFALCRLLGLEDKLPKTALPAAWIAGGAVVFTQTTYFTATIVGYSRLLCITAVVASLLFALAAIKIRPFTRSELNDWRKELHEHAKGIAFAALAALLVAGTLYASTLTPSNGGLNAGGWNWSDYLVHYSIITTVNNGNFPPQTPFFAGQPLAYDWLADFHAAIIANAAGGMEKHATFLQSALFTLALALATYHAALALARNKRAALFAVTLLLLGGGLGWLRLAEKTMAGANAAQLITSESFDNSWAADAGYYRIPSVMGTGLLAHRSTTAGLAIFAVAAMLLILAFKDRKLMLAVGVLTALATPFRYFAFAATLAFAAAFALDETRREGIRTAASRAAWFFLPALAGFAFLPAGSGIANFSFNWGWEAPKDPLHFALFYAANFGVPLLLALAGILTAKVERKTALLLAAAMLFAVPNIVSFTHIAWDMNKFFQFMTLPLCVLAGGALAKAPKTIAAVLLAAAIASPVLVMAWFATSELQALNPLQLQAAEWIAANTPRDAVFATPNFINQPTDYAGRLRLTTFPPYAENYGFNPAERERDLNTAYCGTPQQAAQALAKHGAQYIIDDPGRECSKPYRESPLFEKVFDNGLAIYRVRN